MPAKVGRTEKPAGDYYENVEANDCGALQIGASVPKSPRIEIEYCTQCRWLLRAAWMAQELLTTFPSEIGELALTPGTGGVFEIRVDGETVWSREATGRFPEIKDLKQVIRDRIAPEKDL